QAPPHTSFDRVMKNRVDRSRTPSRTSAGPYRNFSWPRVVGTYCDPPTVARSVEFASNTLECGGIAPCSTIVTSSDVTFFMLTRAWGIRRAVLSLRPPIRSCAPPTSTQWRSVTFSASANASIKRRSTATVIGPLSTTESKHAVARPPPTVTDSVSVTPLTQPSAVSPPPPPALAGGTSNGRHASPTPPARQLHTQSENDAVSASKHASDVLFSEHLQQRPSPSAAVGAFLLHRRRRAPPPSKTQRDRQPHATASTECERSNQPYQCIYRVGVVVCVCLRPQKEKKHLRGNTTTAGRQKKQTR
ncbi:hypothetical protein TcCL_Unassigned05723, partial [Trypanosoma cruzi]